jgi:hypothetical protein
MAQKWHVFLAVAQLPPGFLVVFRIILISGFGLNLYQPTRTHILDEAPGHSRIPSRHRLTSLLNWSCPNVLSRGMLYQHLCYFAFVGSHGNEFTRVRRFPAPFGGPVLPLLGYKESTGFHLLGATSLVKSTCQVDPNPIIRTKRNWRYRRQLRASKDQRGGSTCRRRGTRKNRLLAR